jgi:hypothetical protein
MGEDRVEFFREQYLAKDDAELVQLYLDRARLLEDARTALWQEIVRRGLDKRMHVARVRRPSMRRQRSRAKEIFLISVASLFAAILWNSILFGLIILGLSLTWYFVHSWWHARKTSGMHPEEQPVDEIALVRFED